MRTQVGNGFGIEHTFNNGHAGVVPEFPKLKRESPATARADVDPIRRTDPSSPGRGGEAGPVCQSVSVV
jgi:hypothetical protein